MFRKSERLNRTAFTEYFKIGRRFHSDNYTLIYSPVPFRAAAVVVGKKVFKGAVDRNTLRRRVYAALRITLDTRKFTTGIYIIITKPAAKNYVSETIMPEIESLLAMAVKPR
jgi:ribonuclease P protein component